MADDKPNIVSKLFQHALTTAVGVAVTFYVTKAIKDEAYKEDQSQKEKQRSEATVVNNEKIMAYESKLDSLTRENMRLKMQLNGNMTGGESNNNVTEETAFQNNAVSNQLVQGNYITADGSVQWSFNGGRINVGGVGSYSGMMEGSGNYNASGGQVSGSVLVTKVYYLPYNGTVSFSLSFNYDQTALIGNLNENGQITPVVLYKQ